MNTQSLNFEGSHGETLEASVDTPEDGNHGAMALFAHCFTCSKDLRAVRHIARALTDRGIGVFRFDFTGLGESAGDFSQTTFLSNVNDLVKAAEFMESDFGAPKILIGHSLGGAAVLRAASDISSSQCVATIGAPYEPEHVTNLFSGAVTTIKEKGEADVSLAGHTFTIRKEFLDDLTREAPEDYIHDLRKALLILHSPTDNTVGIDNAADIFQAAKHPKSFMSLDNADHLLTNPQDSQYAGQIIAAWASRYINKKT